MIRLLLFVSQISPKTTQTNCGVPLRIYRPTMVKWNSLHMTSFAEESGQHLLRSASFMSNFRCIWLVFDDPHGGLFCFDRSLFLSACQNVRALTRINSFYGHLLIQHRMYVGGKNAQGLLYLTICHMTILLSMFFGTTTASGRPSRTLSLRDRRRD